jgi:hypothetical protein
MCSLSHDMLDMNNGHGVSASKARAVVLVRTEMTSSVMTEVCEWVSLVMLPLSLFVPLRKWNGILLQAR